MTDDPDPWEAARERSRQQVREAFAAHLVPDRTRTCLFCGHEAATRREHCPACERSYFDRPPRLSRKARRGLLACGVVAFLAFLVWFIPSVVSFRQDSSARQRAKQSAIVAAERARLTAEQRPRHGRAPQLRPPGAATRAERLQARRSLVDALERDITRDAAQRVDRALLSGSRPGRTRCGPLVRNQTVGDEADLTKAVGRYSCVAVQREVRQDGKRVGLYGIPFVASIDFRRFTYVWCKDNPAANVAEAKDRLAFVRPSRECLATRGRAFGTGYVEPSRQPPG